LRNNREGRVKGAIGGEDERSETQRVIYVFGRRRGREKRTARDVGT